MSILSRQADVLRLLAERLGQNDLRAELHKPGINEALRLSIHYHDGRAPDSVATVKRGFGASCQLKIIYDKHVRLNEYYNYEFAISLQRYQKMLAALRLSHFDEMDDEADLPVSGVDLWLLERASGSFFRDVVLAPVTASGHHREFVIAFRAHLPEAVRELTV